MQTDLAEEKANADGMRGGGGVALTQETPTADFLFDFHDLPGCKGADSICQSVNIHIYECPMQSVAHILQPYIYVCSYCYKLRSKHPSSYSCCHPQSGETLLSCYRSVLMYSSPSLHAIYYSALLLPSSQ